MSVLCAGRISLVMREKCLRYDQRCSITSPSDIPRPAYRTGLRVIRRKDNNYWHTQWVLAFINCYIPDNLVCGHMHGKMVKQNVPQQI